MTVKSALKIEEKTLASAFYEGCGQVGKFLDGTIDYAVKTVANFTKKILRKIGDFFSNIRKTIFSWGEGLWKFLNEDPTFIAAKGIIKQGISFFVGVGAALAACTSGLYQESTSGKWIVAGGIGILGILAVGSLGLPAFLVTMALAVTAKWLVGTAQKLWTFNWNITDAELEKQSRARFDNLYTTLGSSLGALTANLVCGALPGVTTVAFNPRMLVHIKKELGEDIYEDCLENIWQIVNGYTLAFKADAIAYAFKNFRRVVKLVNGNPDLKGIFGPKISKAIDAWGEDATKRFVFSEIYEEKIEAIKKDNKNLGNFLENFGEEYMDNCGEKLVMWSNSVLSYNYP